MHRRTASDALVTDGRILGEIDRLRRTLRLAQQTEKFNPHVGVGSVPDLERQLADLAEKAAESSTTFTVQALPGEEFDELVRRHPPSSDQLEHYREQVKAAPWLATMIAPPEMNHVSMGPVLFARSLVEPDWSADEVEVFWQGLSKGEQNQLWNLAHSVQVDEADLPFFNAATGTTNGGGEPSTIAVNGASPSHSS